MWAMGAQSHGETLGVTMENVLGPLQPRDEGAGVFIHRYPSVTGWWLLLGALILSPFQSSSYRAMWGPAARERPQVKSHRCWQLQSVRLASTETMRWEDMGGHPQHPYSLDNQSVSTDQHLVASPKSLLEMYNLRQQPSPIKSKSDFKTPLGNKYTQQSLGSSGLQCFCKYSHSFNRHWLKVSKVPGTPLGAEDSGMDKSKTGSLRSLWGISNTVH